MNITLPREVKKIIGALEDAGFEAFAVGGCIRDSLLGRTPKDWDITTEATPAQIKEIFPITIDTGIEHGTVTVRLYGQSFEVTTYRCDGEYLDGRHPREVTFVRDLKEDLRRRDFTINALAYNESTGLVDEFDGFSDLKAGIIRCVDDSRRRFEEDALRMLRAVRFSAQLDFVIEEETKDSIKALAPSIRRVSTERITDELIKLICTDHPEKLMDLCKLGLTAHFLPEWDRMVDTPQNTKHHRADVGWHTIYVMQGVSPQKHLRLAALLHDVAKPLCRKTDPKGVDHFTGHPQLGADMAKDILKRLKLDNDTIHIVSKLVRFHDERPPLTTRSIRRALNRMGLDIFPDLFELRRADILGQSDYMREEKLQQIDGFEKLHHEILENKEAIFIKDLQIGGAEIIKMGMAPGPGIGMVLSGLLEEVLKNPELNEKETLMSMARDQIKKVTKEI